MESYPNCCDKQYMSFPLPLSLYHLLGIDTNKKTLMKLKMVKLGKLDLSYEILFLETNTYKRERKFGFNTTLQTFFLDTIKFQPITSIL